MKQPIQNQIKSERYLRQMVLPEIGILGQKKLAKAKILLIGLGGLGCPAALYLAAAGIGTLGLADTDRIDITNLQRQILYTTADLKKKKTAAAKKRLSLFNPKINLITLPYRFNAKQLNSHIPNYDFIIDATDNFDSKFAINDGCVQHQKPFSHAGVTGFLGQAMTYIPGSACLRCLFKTAPNPKEVPPCSQAGIIGVTAGVLGIIQATEAIKTLLSIHDLITNRLLICNLKKMEFRNVQIKKNKNCICKKN